MTPAHRTCNATPKRQRCRREHDSHSNEHYLRGLAGQLPPRPSHALHPREQHVPRAPRESTEVGLTWDTTTATRSPECPATNTGRKASQRANEFHSTVRNTGTEHENPGPLGPRIEMKRVVGWPFDARARSQPTQATQSPLTRRHVHWPQHHQANHPPLAARQMGKWKHRVAPRPFR